MSGQIEEIATLAEATPIKDVFSTGMRPVQRCGEYVRLVFHCESELVATVVMPTGAFNCMIKLLSGVSVLLE